MSKFDMSVGNVIASSQCHIGLRNVYHGAIREVLRERNWTVNINGSCLGVDVLDKGEFGGPWLEMITSTQLKLGDKIELFGLEWYLKLEIVYFEIRSLKMYAVAEQRQFTDRTATMSYKR